MKKKSQYIDRRQHASLKTQSIVVRVHNSKDFVKSDRIEWLKLLHAEWLKLLHAEWLAKRSSIFNNNKEISLINEPDELDIEVYW